jgi:uncharacterized Zn finger protein
MDKNCSCCGGELTHIELKCQNCGSQNILAARELKIKGKQKSELLTCLDCGVIKDFVYIVK